MPVIFKLRRDTAVNWATKNPILAEGEMGLEIDTGMFKIGSRVKIWNDLPYFVHTDVISEMIDAAIADAPGAAVDLYNHIQSLNPHPVYDEGPSLVLLYLNAKV